MLHWFALAVVTLSALLAARTTLIVWRLRTATPRTISLALSLGACVALLVTAADIPLALPARWCTESVSAGTGAEPLRERVRAVLDSWTWRVWPCGRVAVRVVPADLEAPLAVGELVERATAARVTVDVTLSQEIPRPGQPLELALKDRIVTLPTSTPIPLSYADRVIPKFAETNVSVECQIDDRAPLLDTDLMRLVNQPVEGASDAHGEGPLLGFHRLRCWPIGQPQSTSTTYVHFIEAGVVFASSERSLIERFLRCRSSGAKDPAECIGLDLGAQDPFALQVPVVVEEGQLRGTASMLVLDRPQRPEVCQRALELLELGATVVVAMPGEGFFDTRCKQWFPIAPKENAEYLVFDRTPSLTFAFDTEFENGLDRSPSVVLHSQCEGQSFEVKPLEQSDDAQREAARQLCLDAAAYIPGAQCQTPAFAERFNSGSHSFVREFKRSEGESVESCQGSWDCERLERSNPVRAVFGLADELAAHKEAWENEVLVIFTHDHRPADVLDHLQNFASRVRVVPIDDPYGISLSANFRGATNRYAITHLPEVLASEHPRSVRLIAPDRTEEVNCVDRSVPPVALDFSSLFAGTNQTRARFRFGDEVPTRFPRERPDERPAPTEAPNRFGWWERPTGEGEFAPVVVELASTTTDAGLVERPLMLGAMTGRGHLLFLSYSPFETSAGPTTVIRREVLGGLRALRDLYTVTEAFVGEIHGDVLAVEPQVDGAVWIKVVRDDLRKIDRGLRALTLTWSGGSIEAPLVDFSIERRSLTYAVPAAVLERLDRCTPLELSENDSSRVFACPPDHTSSTRLMAAVDALAQLAFYTGGRLSSGTEPDASADRSHTLHTRPLGLGMLALLFLTAWGRRAVRRLGGRLAGRRLRDSAQMVQRRYDPPEAVVAAAGDWDGRATTWPRTGAFGGYRAIEPGDRASAVVLSDLLVRQLEGTPMLPRVTLRIEEAAPSVAVFVNLGTSMRGPGGATDKARFAARVGHHIAAAAWKIGGEVSMHAVGIDGEPELVEPVRLNPGYEAIEDNLHARLRQRPARDPAPWPRDRPECGAVVYVSDFQLEDERELQTWLSELESAGIRVAGVMIYSPHEFTMIEGGRLAGSGVWADRTDWDPDDVFAAFSRRRDQIERIFDSVTTGGLAVAATTFYQDDIELALAGGRLLQILR